MSERAPDAGTPAPQQAIGQAIQGITAARLGRGFVPLAVLGVVGIAELGFVGPGRPGGWSLLLGAGATAGAMLAFGLRNVQLVFGRPRRAWMTLAGLGSLIPPAFGLYVIAWRGLREVAVGEGTAVRLLGVFLSVLGVWALRSWMKLLEVQALGRAMALPGMDDGGAS
jgi:hypothetical protein